MSKNTVMLSITIPKELHAKFLELKPTGFKLSKFIQEKLRESMAELVVKSNEQKRGCADAVANHFDPLDLGFIQGVYSDLFGHWSDVKRAEYLRKRFNMTDKSIDYCIGYFKCAATHGCVD
jgi:hypothetical protein